MEIDDAFPSFLLIISGISFLSWLIFDLLKYQIDKMQPLSTEEAALGRLHTKGRSIF